MTCIINDLIEQLGLYDFAKVRMPPEQCRVSNCIQKAASCDLLKAEVLA